MRTKSTTDIDIKIILGAIVYLIIASVLSFNYQFLHEVLAQAAPNDLGPGGNKGGDGQHLSSSEGASQGAKSDEGVKKPHYYNHHVHPSDLTDGASTDPPKPTALPDIASPGAFPKLNHDTKADNKHDSHKFRHNAEDIAMELSSLTPQEIKEYPITDLSNKDIILVLGFLEPADLTKVLLYIPQQDLITIEHRLVHHDFNEYLNRLSESDRIQVESRLVSTSGSIMN
jgi:hypothetical protein